MTCTSKFGNLEAVLWDMDGVLIDSRAAHFAAFRKVFEKYNVAVTNTDFAGAFGMTNEQTVQLITGGNLDPEFVQKLSLEKDVYFREMIASRAILIDGVESWLAEFKRNGVRQAVASSGSTENIRLILKTLRLGDYFEATSSGEDCASKPDPIVFLRAAQDLNIIPAHCLVIEDAVVGVQAAVSAGMQCVAITTSHKREELSEAGLVIDRFTDDNLRLVSEKFKF
jgi:HAD superfamily hydrolase (TIGR01509 family)